MTNSKKSEYGSQAWAEQATLDLLRSGRERDFVLNVSVRDGHWIVALNRDVQKQDPFTMPAPPPTGEGGSLSEALRALVPWDNALTPARRAFLKYRDGIGYHTNLKLLSALAERAWSIHNSKVDCSYFGRASCDGANVTDIDDRLMEARALAECCAQKLELALKAAEEAEGDLFVRLEPDNADEWEAGYKAAEQGASDAMTGRGRSLSWLAGYCDYCAGRGEQ